MIWSLTIAMAVNTNAHPIAIGSVSEKWNETYNGSGNRSDKGLAMVTDDNGNSYVTGKSYNGHNYDYATIKYNSAGVERWTATFNGPANGNDEAIAVTVDAAGNVYVTGKSYNGTATPYSCEEYTQCQLEDAAASMGWILSLVDAEDWVMLMDIVYEMCQDGVQDGAVCMENPNYDYATIKYNSQGVEQWVAFYNGTGNANDYAKDLEVDNAGNVYVTGNSAGNGSGYDFATVKYDGNGVEQWVERYNRANFNEGVSSIALDASANVIVAGGSTDCFGCANAYTTIKYNSDGITQWTRIGNGTGGYGRQLWGKVSAMEVDAAGNIYITGNSFFYTSGTASWSYGPKYYSYVTRKFNSKGALVWSTNSAIVPIDAPVDVKIDTWGNVYVAGTNNPNGGLNGPAGFDNYIVIKYSSTGSHSWIRSYNDTKLYSDGSVGNTHDYAKAMTIDAAGSVYVTGNSYYSGQNLDIATVKFDTYGVEQWRTRHNGLMNQNDDVAAISVDGNGKYVWVSGSTRNNSYNDYVTIKYRAKNNGNKMGETEDDIVNEIEDISEFAAISVYPNPSNGVIHIDFSDYQEKVQVILYGSAGQQLLNQELNGYIQNTLDLSAYPKGVYFLRLVVGSEIESRKIVLH